MATAEPGQRPPAPHRDRGAKRHREEVLLEQAITGLRLEDAIDTYLRSRYLEYMRWLEDGSARNLTLYYALRIPAIIIAATIPALVALDPGTTGRIVTVVLGVIVAAALAVEQFLSSGRRWRHYRGTVELMKSEGWQYLGLAGPYTGHATLNDGFPSFVARVETLMRDEVREYVTMVVAERQATTASNTRGTST